MIIIVQFLLLITEDKLEEAFQMSEQILQFEPNNKLILEYRSALEQSIKGLIKLLILKIFHRLIL